MGAVCARMGLWETALTAGRLEASPQSSHPTALLILQDEQGRSLVKTTQMLANTLGRKGQ